MSRKRKKRKHTVGDFIRGAILLVALAVFLFSGYQLFQIYREYKTGTDEYDQIRQAVFQVQTEKEGQAEGGKADADAAEENDSGQGGADQGESADSEDSSQGGVQMNVIEKNGPILINGIELNTLLGTRYQCDFSQLLSINPEVVGWIRIEDTNIDYPMVQADDNEKYLRLTLDGQWNNAGTIFVDYRVEEPFVSENTMIHGHNQRNKAMFHDLTLYLDQAFWESHPYVSVLTPEKNYLYQIYSCYQSPNVSKTYNCQFSGEEQYQDYLDYTVSQSLYDTGVSVTSSDRILTLSTCNNDWEDTRMVVHAKLISSTTNA